MPSNAERIRDVIILVARILLVVLFVVLGWSKLSDYSGTASHMAHVGIPIPSVATWWRWWSSSSSRSQSFSGPGPLALLLALYTLATALIAHHFWTMEGDARYDNAIDFYRNISIFGGLLLLYVTGAGSYSVDARLGSANP